MRGILIALLMYMLVNYQGASGPFPSYAACRQSRADNANGGACLTVPESGSVNI